MEVLLHAFFICAADVGGSLARLSAHIIRICRAHSPHYVGCWVFVLQHRRFKSVAAKVAMHIFHCTYIEKELLSLLMLQGSHCVVNV